MGKTLFIADLHFGHKNILSFDNRNFRDVESHDNELIRRWNYNVGVDDDVWILGDISWHNATKTIEIFKQLNGIKHLCKGNHDGKLLKNKQVQELFVEICDYKEIQLDNGKGIVLCHYPIPCYNNHFYGWYHLYGHVHNSFEWNMMRRNQYEMTELYNKSCKMYNVGCMMPYIEYMPQTLQDIENKYAMWQENQKAKEIAESPHPDGDCHILSCSRCGSGEYLQNPDENQNIYCGQCGQKIAWEEYDD